MTTAGDDGCGCAYGGTTAPLGPVLSGLALVFALVVRRRRR
jgi:MYXO-CTERM domain-containing protein